MYVYKMRACEGLVFDCIFSASEWAFTLFAEGKINLAAYRAPPETFTSSLCVLLLLIRKIRLR